MLDQRVSRRAIAPERALNWERRTVLEHYLAEHRADQEPQMKRSQSSLEKSRIQKPVKEPLESHKLQEEPAEGDRDTIERELRRQSPDKKRKQGE